jgi:RNA polymerase sigma-70 factor (ECF subfamily)
MWMAWELLMSGQLQPPPHQTVAATTAMESHPNKPLGTVEHCGSPDNERLAQYLDRIAAGDRAGFDALYQLSAPRLWAVVRRMIAHKQPAEDVLQETYLTIWRKAHLFDPTAGEALAWMTTIARHRAIAWLRQPGNAPGRTLTSSESRAGEEAIAEDAPEQSVLFNEVLGKLSREQRESLSLVYLFGMTQEEVSIALKVPLGTVKSRVRRGLIALKDLLDS